MDERTDELRSNLIWREDNYEMIDEGKREFAIYAGALKEQGEEAEVIEKIVKLYDMQEQEIVKYRRYNKLVGYKLDTYINEIEWAEPYFNILGFFITAPLVVSGLYGYFVQNLVYNSLLKCALISFCYPVMIELFLAGSMMAFGKKLVFMKKRFQSKCRLMKLGKELSEELAFRKDMATGSVEAIYIRMHALATGSVFNYKKIFEADKNIVGEIVKNNLRHYDNENKMFEFIRYYNSLDKKFKGPAETLSYINLDILEEIRDIRNILASYPINETKDFYGELNDIVVRFDNYNKSNPYRDIRVRNSIARDIYILRNKINNMAKSKTGAKKRTLERE